MKNTNNISRLKYIIKLSSYIKGFKIRFSLGIIVHIVFKVLPILISILISYMIAESMLNKDININFYILIASLMVVLDAIFYYFDIYISHNIAYYILTQLRLKSYEKVESIAPDGIGDIKSGEILSVVMEDIEILEWFYAHTIGQVLVAVILPIIALIVLSYFSIYLSLSILPFIAVLIFIPLFAKKSSDSVGKALRQATGDLNAKTIDGIQGLTDIISFEYNDVYLNKLNETSNICDELALKYAGRSSNENLAINATISIATLVSEVITVFLVLKGEVGISFILPIFSLSALIYNPILDAIMMSRNYGLIFGAAARVFELLSLKSTVKINENIGYKSIDNYEISFENVVFSYSKNGKRVFDDMSFEVKNGESVVLVGESGCGKSTTARLLSRFYEIDGGAIRIGNEDIRNYNVRQLRDIITVVPQESYLFNRSIKENILMANENATVEDMEKAVKSAQITDIIARMEDEKRSVGEKGSRLSGGERARVSLARAFIRNTPILILDEVSASLDSDNENKINKAVSELKKDRITIIIAHRLSTIKAADRIVLIKDGKVEDSGSYEELFDRSEYFRWLIGSEY